VTLFLSRARVADVLAVPIRLAIPRLDLSPFSRVCRGRHDFYTKLPLEACYPPLLFSSRFFQIQAQLASPALKTITFLNYLGAYSRWIFVPPPLFEAAIRFARSLYPVGLGLRKSLAPPSQVSPSPFTLEPMLFTMVRWALLPLLPSVSCLSSLLPSRSIARALQHTLDSGLLDNVS